MKNPTLIKYQHIPGDIHESTLPSRQLACFLSEAAQPPPAKIDRKIKPSIKVSLALSFSFSRSTSCSACNALDIRELVGPENLSDLSELSRHSLNHPARINTKTWHTHLLVPLKSQQKCDHSNQPTRAMLRNSLLTLQLVASFPCDFDLSVKNPTLIKYQHIPSGIHESTPPSQQLA